MKPFHPGHLNVGSFKIIVLTALSVIICSDFLFFTDSVLGDCIFLRICPFLPCFSFYWYIVLVGAYDSLFICGVCYNFSIYTSSYINLSPLSFLLMNLAKDLSILLIFSKNQRLVSLNFYIFVFHFSFIYLCFDLYDIYTTISFGFGLLIISLVALSVSLSCLFVIFLVSRGKILLP